MFDSEIKAKNSAQIQIPKSEIRILLWDIDGTLMRSKIHGDYKKYFAATMRKVFGSAGNLDDIEPSGMTDTQIICEALKAENFQPERVFERKKELLETFKIEMAAVVAENGKSFETLGGVREILELTARNPRFINALLTGNLSVAAEIKLKSVNLWQYFENQPNAFGEISHDRKDLAIEAGKLFNERYEYEFAPEQFVVIGDTPNDIATARHFGAKVIAVATGRSQSMEKLKACEPDAILEDLTDTKRVLDLLGRI